MSDNSADEKTGETYQAACEVDTNSPPVLSEGDGGERVDTHPPGVIV